MSKDVVPDWVEGFSPEKQVEWFDNQTGLWLGCEEWDRFYCSSVLHKGLHCISCVVEQEDGYGYFDDDRCCCRASRKEQS